MKLRRRHKNLIAVPKEYFAELFWKAETEYLMSQSGGGYFLLENKESLLFLCNFVFLIKHHISMYTNIYDDHISILFYLSGTIYSPPREVHEDSNRPSQLFALKLIVNGIYGHRHYINYLIHIFHLLILYVYFLWK